MDIKLFRYISFIKIVNLVKLKAGYIISIFLKRPVQWAKPVAISFEPSGNCNLSCPQCPTGLKMIQRKAGFSDFDLMKSTINQLSDSLFTSTFYFQGEPFLNPKLYEMIAYAHEKKIFTITSTNGHYLNETNITRLIGCGLDKLIVSVDGVTQEIYEKYRIGGKLQKVISGIENLIKKKKELKSRSPKVVIQFLVTGYNEHQIDEARLLARKLEADKIVFKTAQIYEFTEGSPFIPKNKKYSRYTAENEKKYKIRSKLQNKCYRMWSNPVVTVDGDVVPCCYDKQAEHSMGNLYRNDFKAIWKGSDFNNFRKQLFLDRSRFEICKNCTEGLRDVFI